MTRYLAHAFWYRKALRAVSAMLYSKRDTARHSTTQHVTTSAASATRPSPRARLARYAT